MLLNHCTMDPNPERRSQNTLCSAAALLPQLQLNVTPLSKTHPSLIQRLEVCIKKSTLALWQIQQCIFLTQLSGWLGDGGHLTLQQLQLNSESGNAAISNQARVLKRQSCSKHSAVRCIWAQRQNSQQHSNQQLSSSGSFGSKLQTLSSDCTGYYRQTPPWWIISCLFPVLISPAVQLH